MFTGPGPGQTAPGGASTASTLQAGPPFAQDHGQGQSLDPQDIYGSTQLKRRKLSPVQHDMAQPTSQLPTLSPAPSTPALLYHFASSAHHASHRHLQQTFVHRSISTNESPPLPLYTDISPTHTTPFHHDPDAAAKALGLQLIALDLLRAGLNINTLSESERVAFGVQFGVVGIKVLTHYRTTPPGKGKGPDKSPAIDLARLTADLQDVIGQSHFIAQRQTSMTSSRYNLELLNARIAFILGKTNLAKRMIQHYLATSSPPSHRYALYLLFLEYAEPTGSPDFIAVIDEASLEATRNGHIQVVQLLAIARTRFVFFHRRWELVPHALQSLAATIGWVEDPNPASAIGILRDDKAWDASKGIHYLMFSALWQGRIGNDATAKAMLRKMYPLMDAITDASLFKPLRARGGVHEIHLPGDRSILVQITPPNILYMLTYLTTVVSRRDYTGSNSTCKNLVHSLVFRETENNARPDDMWDIGFCELHGVAAARSLQRQVMSIRAEIMTELATTLLYRSRFRESHQLLLETVEHVRTHDLFHPYCARLCLIFGHHANLLGLDELANRYYRACIGLINQGSELSLIAEICSIAAQNLLADVLRDPQLQRKVHALSDRCKASTSAMFNAAGHFLASLTDENRVRSKRDLSTAYEIAQRSNNNLLRLLIFAFTTSTHHFGGRDRIFRQLETGRELARLFGGRDRPDGVGQVILGLWFAKKLKDYYRQEGDQTSAAQAKASVSAHKARLEEIRAQAHELASFPRRAVKV